MYNPEPTDLLVSVLCLYLTARLLVGRRYGRGAAFVLGLALGAGEMVRQFALWTLAVVVLAFVAAFIWRRSETAAACGHACARARRLRARRGAVVRVSRRHLRECDLRPSARRQAALRAAARAASTSTRPCPTLFTHPYRPHFVNLAVPQTYADMWGDWYGVFEWSYKDRAVPPPATRGWLSAQMIFGLVPTALAIIGWLVLLARSLIERRPERLVVALLPLAGIAGYLYFTVSYPTPDGDVLKPTYMLSTLGAWALGFGLLVDRLGARRPRLVAVTLAVTAVLLLPFVLYKGAAGWL